jgi:hypothetical protein
VAHELTAEDVVLTDRRQLYGSNTHDRAELGQGVGSMRDTFPHATYEALATRGDRLALLSIRFSNDDGFELPMLCLYEVDESDLISRIGAFDDTALVAAIDALEDRYAQLSGESYSELERRYVDTVHRYNHGDYRAALADLAPDYLTIDHGPLGFGTSDAAAMVEQVELMASSVEEIVQLAPQRLVAPRAILSVTRMFGTTADGGDILWDYVIVRCYDTDGLVTRDHTFQAEQWDEALTLLDELESEASAPS